MKKLIACLAALMIGAPGYAQPARVTISDKATYNDALICYQHYTVAREIARKLEQHPKLSADQAAGFELQAILARKVMASWSIRLDATTGPRTEAQVSADVKRVGAPIIADANLALGGDAAAARRSAIRSATCSGLEVVTP